MKARTGGVRAQIRKRQEVRQKQEVKQIGEAKIAEEPRTGEKRTSEVRVRGKDRCRKDR